MICCMLPIMKLYGQAHTADNRTRVQLTVLSNEEQLRGELTDFYHQLFSARPSVTLTDEQPIDLKLDILIIRPDTEYLDYFAVSVLVVRPFHNRYLAGLLDICRRAEGVSELSENQKKIIQDATVNRELGTVIHHSVHATSERYLRKSCEDIAVHFYDHILTAYRNNQRVMDEMLRDQIKKDLHRRGRGE